MKAAISIIEQELAYAKAHRKECPHNDDYYFGWCESLKAAIATLQMAANTSQSAVISDTKKIWLCSNCKRVNVINNKVCGDCGNSK